ncbi:hypothetical protein SEA_JONJAMES_68 [Gordonia Phage JonJames]|nr:hypothetical protein SEA_JONJAMES_68 [Gordonia Phage JonJames]
MPDSKFMVIQKPNSPYKYFGPFDTHDEAEKYIETKELKMSYVAELRKP